ncbi:MAG TPA: TIR domain-containing protein, partial [Kofleriaceae bacterium]|nr:TIR domain-containing protein [Kofleriaceae bacterium]
MELQGERGGAPDVSGANGASAPAAADPAPAGAAVAPAGAPRVDAYDLFVVYAASDAEFVHGYLLPALAVPAERVLLVEQLAPGAAMLDEISRGVARSRFTIAVLSPAYLTDHWAVLGEQLASTLSIDDADDVRILPLRLVSCPLPLHLDARVGLDFTDRARWDGEAARLRARLHAPPPADDAIACPYPGMRPFAAGDAAWFFGRGPEIDELIGRLDRGEREVYVIGPSGSGKSSLVQAGLLHALAAGSSRLGRSFAVRSLRPGEQPADRLAAALGGDAAAATIDAVLAGATATRVLVFIDQLEELFTHADAAGQQRFIAALRALRAEPRCCVVLALRADFYGALMSSALWADLAGRISRIDVAPLRGPALAQAISQPAQRVGVYVETRLCDRLVVDAADEPGALPHVQETLRVLWDRRHRRLIGLADYEALGRGQGGASGLAVAIAQHADTALRELAPARQAIARRLLLRLVSFGEGRADTRRQQPVAALASAADTADELATVLQHLVGHRLVAVSDAERPAAAVADLAHEALITAWPAFAGWIVARRADELRRRRLETMAADWVEHGRGDTGLLDRGELAEAVLWIGGEAGRELGAAAELAALVAASQRALDRQDLARRRAARRIIAGLAAFSLVVSVLGLVVWRQRVAAQRRADDEEAALGRSYLDQGRALLFDSHPMRALPYLAAARAHAVDDPLLGLLFARAAAALPRVTLVGHTAAVVAAAFSPDGHRAVTASRDHTARIWNIDTGRELTPPLVHGELVRVAAFSPDGTRVVTASSDGTARVWDASTGAPVTPPLAAGPSHDALRPMMWHAAFSPDGTRVVTASNDWTAQVWDAATGARVTPPLRHDHVVVSATFSRDGTRVITASWDRTAAIWDAATGAALQRFQANTDLGDAELSPDGTRVVTSGGMYPQLWDAATGEELDALQSPRHWGSVRAVAFSPDGSQLLTASDDQTVRFWDARQGQESGPPLHLPDGVDLAAFSADGKRVVTVSGDRTVRIWNEDRRQVVAELEHARDVNDAAFSPDGTAVITASNDGTVRIWDAVPRPAVPFVTLTGAAGDAAFSPDGARVVTAGPGPTAQVWLAATGAPLTPALVHAALVSHAAFSADGTRVITGAEDGTARVWDAWSGLPVTPPLVHHRGGDRFEADVTAAAFSPDGARALTVGADAAVRLWDARTGASLGAPLVHEFTVTAAAFSRDGRQVITSSGSMTLSPDGQQVMSSADFVRTWDAATGVRIATPVPRGGKIEAFSRDGRRAITLDDEVARVRDTRTWTALPGRLEHDNEVYCAALSGDGRYAITGSADHTAKIWDATTGALIAPPLAHATAVLAVAFSADATRVVTVDSEQTARIWDRASGKLSGPPLPHPGSPRTAQFSPDGTRLITSDRERTRLWTIVVDPGSLDQWRSIARCSPFVLDGGILQPNP